MLFMNLIILFVFSYNWNLIFQLRHKFILKNSFCFTLCLKLFILKKKMIYFILCDFYLI